MLDGKQCIYDEFWSGMECRPASSFCIYARHHVHLLLCVVLVLRCYKVPVGAAKVSDIFEVSVLCR